MKSIRSAVILVALVTAGCGGVTVSPSAVPSSPPASTASPTAALTVAPTVPVSLPAGDVLRGTWAVSETTCAQQQAAVEAAGFTAEQLTSVGWTPDCPGAYTIRFANGRLVQFSRDGSVGWEGNFRILDDDTFEAGNFASGCYISYDYAIDGDQLTIDMVEDICPAWSPAELLGDSIIQTEIYETSPFTRQS
jgi:hypothetical protein